MKINWEEHIAAFRASSQTVAAYCTSAGIKQDAFKYHLYRTKQRRPPEPFEEFRVATELVISRGSRGELTISGFDVAHLPQIVSAWSNALS